MQEKREIYAIDYCVVELVSALDRLFRFAVNPLTLQITGGLNVAVEDGHTMLETYRLWVQPVSWKKDSGIFVRIQKTAEGWKAFEGRLRATHLPEELADFQFECEWDINGYYRFRGKGTEDERVFNRLLTARAATEIHQD